MPSPSTSLETLRPDLASSFEEFDLAADQAGYIGHRAMRIIETQAQAGVFGKIPIEQLLQNADTARSPGSGYSRGNFTFTKAAFACEEHGHEEPVDRREAKMYAEYFDAELVSTARAFNAVLRNAEKRVADALFNTTTWTGASLTTAITHEWDDASNAVPVTDVEAAVQAVYAGSGLWPNALIVNKKVFRNLRLCDQVRDRISSSGAGTSEAAGNVTVQHLQEVFDLPYILVAGGSENTANEGQDASISQIWSDEYAMVCKIATTDDFREPCVGRTFHWGEDGSSAGGTVESYYEPAKRSDIIRVRHDVDEIVLYPQAGHLLSNVTT